MVDARTGGPVIVGADGSTTAYGAVGWAERRPETPVTRTVVRGRMADELLDTATCPLMIVRPNALVVGDER